VNSFLSGGSSPSRMKQPKKIEDRNKLHSYVMNPLSNKKIYRKVHVEEAD